MIPGVQRRQKEISAMLDRLKSAYAQQDMDGCKNVWIVKPGAKSRGRGELRSTDHIPLETGFAL